MSLQNSINQFQEGVLSFVWRQWGQLGVSAAFTHRDAWCQDPEALLAFTLEVARWDPRMFDEVLDWLGKNGQELMWQRLKNVMNDDPAMPRRVIEAAYDLTVTGKTSSRIASPSTTDLEALFCGDSELVSDFGPPDPVFQAFGLQRPTFRRSGKSALLRRREPIALAFRLRAVFGASARSEALRYLLLRPERHAGTVELADAAALSRFALQKTLEELADAGIIERGVRGQRDLVWWLEDLKPFDWMRSADGALPAWVGWLSVYRGMAHLWRWLGASERATESPYIQASGAKALMSRVAPLLQGQGLPWKARNPNDYPGAAYLEVFRGDVEALLAIINEQPAPSRPC